MSDECKIGLTGGLCYAEHDSAAPRICVYDPEAKWEPREESARSSRLRADGIEIQTETTEAYMERYAQMRQDEFETMLAAFKEAAGMSNIEFDACGTACLRGLIEGMRYLYCHHGGDYNDSDKAMYHWFDKAGEWQGLRPLP